MSYLGNSPGVSSQRVVTTLTASEGQTNFVPLSGYTLGYLDVYRNGVKLINGTDYTASNGTDFTLTEGAVVNDTIEAVAYIARGLSDGYTKTEADTRFLNVSGDSATSATLGTLAVTGNSTLGNVTVANNLTMAESSQLQFGDGNTYIQRTPSEMIIRNSDTSDIYLDAEDVWIRVNRPNGYENAIAARANGSVSLYYDAVEKLYTTSTGVDVTGEITADGIALGDNQKAKFGASDDLQIFHDGSASYIKDVGTGNLNIDASNLSLRSWDGAESYIDLVDNSYVQIRHDNAVKLATTSTGIDVTGTTDTDTVTLPNGWVVSESGGNLYFAKSGTNKMKLDADGNLQVVGNVESNATIS